ncbi:beta-ketothiolase BktB [Magnetospira sp. QH-2]|uniref:beta-ketothiolase BktB n=1 Tax=Magnetospira sp. (strain QH-2) TaxID=1288970 RepID=UPI0003E811A4|nr:beta-ketothiolase BktB [Magnetospira sp. QH-2]CCQ74027.1 Acetyl-CoA acetyltransferase with thiolase domain (Acetoacetyl-CoA thiolase) [Magnetospira sp. QH-2]
MTQSVVFLSGVRTAIGDFGGGLRDVEATKLASTVVAESVKRAGVSADLVDHCVIGNVIHSEPRDMYISRVACIDGGLPQSCPALTLNRLCGSGMQAIVSASQMIMLGDATMAVAGGAENMSRSGYTLQTNRWGAKMGDSKMIDMMVGALSDPFGAGHMGITAENVANRYGVSREEQDAFAAESHRRAIAAQAAGHFDSQIVDVEVKQRKKVVIVNKDEHPRGDVTAESLSGLRAAFDREGSVTAGNASSLNDGAAAVVVASEEAASKAGATPIARLVGYGFSGVQPDEMGIGPVTAVQQALAKTGMKLDDMDVVESNEAFAAQACAVGNKLGFDAAKTNPNGGAVALGHPIGATGAIITVKLIYELQRTGGRYGLATMCIGGGQGIAMIIERL